MRLGEAGLGEMTQVGVMLLLLMVTYKLGCSEPLVKQNVHGRNNADCKYAML